MIQVSELNYVNNSTLENFKKMFSYLSPSMTLNGDRIETTYKKQQFSIPLTRHQSTKAGFTH